MSDSNNGGASLVGLTGCVLAGLMSYAKWHSIFWALIHSVLCGWVYVVYYLFKYGVPNF